MPRIMLQPNGSGIACNPVVLIISNLLQFIRLVHKVFLFFFIHLFIYLFICLFTLFIYLFIYFIYRTKTAVYFQLLPCTSITSTRLLKLTFVEKALPTDI